MTKYFLVLFVLTLLGIAVKLLRGSVKNTFNNENDWNLLARKIRAFSGIFVASLLAIFLVFINFAEIREYLLSILSEKTITSAYSVIRVLFGAPSVTYALNTIWVYAFVGSGIFVSVAFAVQFLNFIILLTAFVVNSHKTKQDEPQLKESFLNRLSFLTFGKIRI